MPATADRGRGHPETTETTDMTDTKRTTHGTTTVDIPWGDGERTYRVEYDHSPADPDVGEPEALALTSVRHTDAMADSYEGELLPGLSESEEDAATDAAWEHVRGER